MRRRVTLKSNERRSDLFSGQTSKQYSSMGRHLVFTRCRKTSSDADLPSLPNKAFTDLKKERLALICSTDQTDDCLATHTALSYYSLLQTLLLKLITCNLGVFSSISKNHQFYQKFIIKPPFNYKQHQRIALPLHDVHYLGLFVCSLLLIYFHVMLVRLTFANKGNLLTYLLTDDNNRRCSVAPTLSVTNLLKKRHSTPYLWSTKRYRNILKDTYFKSLSFLH